MESKKRAGENGLGKFFGTDGFRGAANVMPSAKHAFMLGCFLAEYYRERGKAEDCRIVIGKDPRLSSYTLEYALAAGVTACGGNACLLHVTTTPSVSYITRSEGFDCGVMISASHNPYTDNGIKLLDGEGEKISDEAIAAAEEYLERTFSPSFLTGDRTGRTVDYTEGRNRYIGYLISLSKCSYRGVKVGLDTANGGAFHIAPAVFQALGAQVFTINASPTGMNINDGCGSTHPEGLARFVLSHGLDVGFAFDGDADRCICVDERGQIVDGDGILYAAALYRQACGEGEGEIVATILSNGGLSDALFARGIGCHRVAVGDKNVRAAMKERNLSLGGEPSGHIVFGKYAATGDGILTAIKVMEMMLESKKPLSALLQGYEPLPSVSLDLPVCRKETIFLPTVQARIKELSAAGRVIVRPSGTENVVRIYAEGHSMSECKVAAGVLRELIVELDQAF